MTDLLTIAIRGAGGLNRWNQLHPHRRELTQPSICPTHPITQHGSARELQTVVVADQLVGLDVNHHGATIGGAQKVIRCMPRQTVSGGGELEPERLCRDSYNMRVEVKRDEMSRSHQDSNVT